MNQPHPHHPIQIQRSAFEWNSLLRHSKPHHSLSIYLHSMLPSSSPNKFTFTFLLKCCVRASLHRLVPLLHAHIVIFGLASDPFLSSSLISAYACGTGRIPTIQTLFAHSPYKDTVMRSALLSAYARCRLPELARQAFDGIPDPNPISWAALVSAYSKAGLHSDALSVFSRMRFASVCPTEAALVSALASSAALFDVRRGQRVHQLIVKTVRALTCSLGTALFSMYARCGAIKDSVEVFEEMPDRDGVTWSAMISAMAAHGRGEDALELFDRMASDGFVPDHITYVSILHACSHNRSVPMIDEAKTRFERMQRVHKIKASVRHYGCMVDVLGRGRRAEEAWEMVKAMPVEPDRYVLKSLMSACCGCGFVEGAEWAAEKLRVIDAGDPSSYVMLSNLYAGLGRWEESERVRRLMRVRGVPKAPGSSAVV